MIVFIFLIIGILTIIFFLYVGYKIEHKKQFKSEEELKKIYNNPPKPFSISKYYDRIEKESINIMSQKEEKDDYKITLWVGLDGIQLNEDGSTEWIKRGKTEKPVYEFKQATSYTSCLQNVSTTCVQNEMQNVCQSKIDSLRSQNQALLLQQVQNLQTQNMINAIWPTYYPTFYYTTPLTSYCPNSTSLYW